MKKILTLIIACTLCYACTNNQELAYNEKMSEYFYQAMQRLDENTGRLDQGGYDVNATDEKGHQQAVKNIHDLETYIGDIKKEVNQLKASEAATDFHQEVNGYLNNIADTYAPLLLKYVETNDADAKSSMKKELAQQKEMLENQASLCQQKQRSFLNKAGIKVNEESVQK